MAEYVDISNIDKRLFIRLLWENATPSIFYEHHPECQPPKLTKDELNKVMKGKTIDYLCGRRLKIHFVGCFVNPKQYNSFGYDKSVYEIVSSISTY